MAMFSYSLVLQEPDREGAMEKAMIESEPDKAHLPNQEISSCNDFWKAIVFAKII